MAAATIPRGATIQIDAVPNFDTLTEDAAEAVLYDTLVPACEAKGVMLSQYGNHAASGTVVSAQEYRESKAGKKLFNVQRVQKAFASVHGIVENRTTYKSGSYGLKHVFEKQQSEYLSNGDLIAAMLVQGYAARFGKQTEGADVNAEFKVVVKA
ncbi:MAG: hypothetical protein P0S96_00045 [Simkaniaceae bacterium]|nr:hypothetical protein [Candidatus Sacchlamyda saccharinae]